MPSSVSHNNLHLLTNSALSFTVIYSQSGSFFSKVLIFPEFIANLSKTWFPPLHSFSRHIFSVCIRVRICTKLLNETQSAGIRSAIWSAEQHSPLWPPPPQQRCSALLFGNIVTQWHFKLLTSASFTHRPELASARDLNRKILHEIT